VSIYEDNGWWRPSAEEPHPVDSQLAECTGQIARAMEYLPHDRRRTVLQAGARVGLWPLMLAPLFQRVIAFEPDCDNYACAVRNVKEKPGVELCWAALGNKDGTAHLMRSSESTGMHYVAPDEPQELAAPVEMKRVDSLLLRDLDAIFLDVEGLELAVLYGAMETLKRCHPLVVLEENELCFRYLRQRHDCTALLEILGYQLVDEWTTLPLEQQQDGFRGSDLIYAPR
jgi:FkbM family methyltransferase